MNEVIVSPETIPASVEISAAVNEIVVAPGSIQATVEVVSPDQTSIVLGLTNIGIRGPVGPVGPAGPNSIGGFPVVVQEAEENDMLQLKSWAWRNIPQEALTDGGNF